MNHGEVMKKKARYTKKDRQIARQAWQYFLDAFLFGGQEPQDDPSAFFWRMGKKQIGRDGLNLLLQSLIARAVESGDWIIEVDYCGKKADVNRKGWDAEPQPPIAKAKFKIDDIGWDKGMGFISVGPELFWLVINMGDKPAKQLIGDALKEKLEEEAAERQAGKGKD